MVQKIAQYQSFVQKGVGVKYRIPGLGIPFKSCNGVLTSSFSILYLVIILIIYIQFIHFQYFQYNGYFLFILYLIFIIIIFIHFIYILILDLIF